MLHSCAATCKCFFHTVQPSRSWDYSPERVRSRFLEFVHQVYQPTVASETIRDLENPKSLLMIEPANADKTSRLEPQPRDCLFTLEFPVSNLVLLTRPKTNSYSSPWTTRCSSARTHWTKSRLCPTSPFETGFLRFKSSIAQPKRPSRMLRTHPPQPAWR
jgi:hypothetical protein